MVRIGKSELDVFPLSLGGNVFGWTSDEETSFAILDAFVAGGGNFIDTADVYSAWVPGNTGGDSEIILGKWMASRGNRDKVVIATKFSSWDAVPGTSRSAVLTAIEGSLQRLQTDYIDLYYIHSDHEETPLEETIGALDELVKAGKVREIAASNFTADRLSQALQVSADLNAATFVALQPLYNLMRRDAYEGALEQVVAEHGLSTLPYSSLASGFLTGKYRQESDQSKSPRGGGAVANLNERGLRVLAALDAVAAAHETSVTAVSLAWMRARPTVIAPIASASTLDQVPDLLASATLELSANDIDALNTASA